MFAMVFGSVKYSGSTTASVTLVAGIIKTKHLDDNTKKYKRKDCPVCKGKGWYMSGDDIQKVDCGYCEPETAHNSDTHRMNKPPISKIIIHQN